VFDTILFEGSMNRFVSTGHFRRTCGRPARPDDGIASDAFSRWSSGRRRSSSAPTPSGVARPPAASAC
jgi:hypothetical protein